MNTLDNGAQAPLSASPPLAWVSNRFGLHVTSGDAQTVVQSVTDIIAASGGLLVVVGRLTAQQGLK